MRYFKPKSVTWWASFVPLAAGVFKASLPFHGQADAIVVLDNMTGGVSAAVLINVGLAGIGLRGAMRD